MYTTETANKFSLLYIMYPILYLIINSKAAAVNLFNKNEKSANGINIALCFLTREISADLNYIANSFEPFYDTYIMVDESEPRILIGNRQKNPRLLGMSSNVASTLGCKNSLLGGHKNVNRCNLSSINFIVSNTYNFIQVGIKLYVFLHFWIIHMNMCG
jgi:hypothetical protein